MGISTIENDQVALTSHTGLEPEFSLQLNAATLIHTHFLSLVNALYLIIGLAKLVGERL